MKKSGNGAEMKENIVIIYGTDRCPHVKNALDKYGENAIYYNVDKDTKRLEELLKYTNGEVRVPVIIEGDKVTIGFNGKSCLHG